MGKFAKNSGETVWVRDTLEGVTPECKAIKSDSDSDSDKQKKGRQVLRRRNQGRHRRRNWQLKKARQVFQEKNRGVTPSVAAPCVTHPSDATAPRYALVLCPKSNNAG